MKKAIANPPGFRNKNAFSLNGIEAAVDYANIIATAIIQEITKEAAMELLKAKASNRIDSIFKKDKD